MHYLICSFHVYHVFSATVHESYQYTSTQLQATHPCSTEGPVATQTTIQKKETTAQKESKSRV